MKENIGKNELFLTRHDELKAEGKSLADMQAIICDEFGITGHSYRAWKSRLNLQYKGRYKARIQPYLVQKKVSATCTVEYSLNGEMQVVQAQA